MTLLASDAIRFRSCSEGVRMWNFFLADALPGGAETRCGRCWLALDSTLSASIEFRRSADVRRSSLISTPESLGATGRE